MLGAASYEIMPGDEKIPSDEKLYPVIWEARNKVCTHIYSKHNSYLLSYFNLKINGILGKTPKLV